MRDIFEFLIVSTTAALTGLYILIIKRIFRDKLPPVWQFGIWGILGITLIFPFTYPESVSFAAELLKSFLTGENTISRPSFFLPLTDFSFSFSIADILFLIYFLGVAAFLISYLISYIRLRILTGRASDLSVKKLDSLNEIAEKYSLKKCRTVTVPEITSPFIFGIIRPVLILPEVFPDDKVILHELIHLKYKDALWSIVISLLRSIHWCNPLLWYIFNKIRNDIEELCDSRVLSLLSGEERREYGNILLSMANEKYASCFASTAIANGGKNIRSRIETIARFKQYPVNSRLICICISIITALFLLVNTRAATVPEDYLQLTDKTSVDVALAVSRSYYCRTPAAAIDAYAKAVLQDNGIYRALCAPLSMHNEIKQALNDSLANGRQTELIADIDGTPTSYNRYYIYNLENTGKNEYTALLVFGMAYHDPDEDNNQKIAYQKIRIFKENERWVVTEESDFSYVITYKMQWQWGCEDLPAYTYSAVSGDFTVERNYQLCFSPEEKASDSSSPYLNASFNEVTVNDFSRCIYNGPEDKKPEITHLGFSCKAGKQGDLPEFPPELTNDTMDRFKNTRAWEHISQEIKESLIGGDFSSSSTTGASSARKSLPEGWDNIQNFSGGGHTAEYKKKMNYLPDAVYGVLYVNGIPSETLTLERTD